MAPVLAPEDSAEGTAHEPVPAPLVREEVPPATRSGRPPAHAAQGYGARAADDANALIEVGGGQDKGNVTDDQHAPCLGEGGEARFEKVRSTLPRYPRGAYADGIEEAVLI
jgi:hypothetical protein